MIFVPNLCLLAGWFGSAPISEIPSEIQYRTSCTYTSGATILVIFIT